MKLGKLNAAIDAAPDVFVQFRFGAVPLKKGALKAALKTYHHGQVGTETGLKISDDHFLNWEQPV